MRRIGISACAFVLLCAVAALAAAVWVDRSLAAVQEKAGTRCVTAKDRRKFASGAFPPRLQDIYVAKEINFHQGKTQAGWWRVRGAAIQITYVTFWSANGRAGEFNRLTSRMKDCPPR